MKAPIPRKLTETSQERSIRRQQSIELLRIRGDNRQPDPPRGVSSQAGSRKAVVSWNAPMRQERVGGYAVYTDGLLYAKLQDPRARQCEVSMTAGTFKNVFVSTISDGGQESARVQVIASSTTEAGAPSDPAPPPAVVEAAPTTIPTSAHRDSNVFGTNVN